MNEYECDVLVIGAGPAGSSAGMAAAKEGLKVLVIEQKEKPSKEACAETLSKALIEYLPIKIPERFLKWKLGGLKFYYEDYLINRNKGIWWKSHPLNRNEFDPYILDLAINEGAEYLPLTRFINLKYDKNFIADKVIAQNVKNNQDVIIRPKIVIAADGLESNVLKSIGKLKEQKTRIGYIKSHEYSNLSLEDSKSGHVYFGDYADGAYAYIFPKSATSANIGIATLSKDNLDERYEQFLKLIENQIKEGKADVERSGEAPIKNPSEKKSYGNILFTGDAANQNLKPFVEGIIPGIICGSIAGKTAANCKFNYKKLEPTYEKMIKKKFGKFFIESNIIEELLVTSFEKQTKIRYLLEMAIFSYILDLKDLKKIKTMNDDEAETYIEKKIKSNS